MSTFGSIQKKLFFQGKIFYCDRFHSEHAFHKGCSSEHKDVEQQLLTEQNKNKE